MNFLILPSSKHVGTVGYDWVEMRHPVFRTSKGSTASKNLIFQETHMENDWNQICCLLWSCKLFRDSWSNVGTLQLATPTPSPKEVWKKNWKQDGTSSGISQTSNTMLLVEMLLRSFRTCKDVNVILLPLVDLNSLSFHVFSQQKLKQNIQCEHIRLVGNYQFPSPSIPWISGNVIYPHRLFKAFILQGLTDVFERFLSLKSVTFPMENTWKFQGETPTHNKISPHVFNGQHLAPWFDPPMLSKKNAPFPRPRLLQFTSKQMCQNHPPKKIEFKKSMPGRQNFPQQTWFSSVCAMEMIIR